MGGLSRRAAGDVALALGLLAFGGWLWLRGLPPDGPPPGAPAWATARDLLLDGPDAGRWAEQAVALQRGAFARLDPHRLPTWTLLTVAAVRLGAGSLPLAGHLVNHLLQAALGPLVFALARLLRVGRVAAVAAGALVLVQPDLLAGAARFQVDGAVAAAWPFALAAALAGGRTAGPGARGAVGPALAGLAVALGFTTHITTLPVVVPGLVAVAAAAPAGRRGAAVAVAFAGFAAGVWAIHLVLPAMTPSLFLPSLLAGIVPIDPSHAPVAAPPLTRVVAALQANGREAGAAGSAWLAATIARGRVPGPVVAALLLLGALGPGLGARPERPPRGLDRVPRSVRLPAEWATRGAAEGGAVLLALGALPALFVAGAPIRYADTLLPVVAVLVVRGLAAAGGALASRVPAAIPGRGVVACVVPVAFVVAATTAPSTRVAPFGDRDAALLVEVGAAIRAHYPEGTDVATFVHEVNAAAGELACPTPDCPTTTTDAALARCLSAIRAGCAGSADTVPYAVVVSRPRDDRFVTRAAMDDFILARWAPFATFDDDTLSVSLVAVPRRADE